MPRESILLHKIAFSIALFPIQLLDECRGGGRRAVRFILTARRTGHGVEFPGYSSVRSLHALVQGVGIVGATEAVYAPVGT